MMTSAECLAKAAQLDAIAAQCFNGRDRDGYSETANGWRRSAVMARQQEAWAAEQALHPSSDDEDLE